MLGRTEIEETGLAPAPSPVSTETKTVIEEAISIQGDIRGQGDLVIQGTVKGSIELEKHHLIVGAKGQVEAEIHAANITVGGRLIGNITALEKVAITKDADFNGKIKAKRISVEDGAYLKASIELERESNITPISTGRSADQNVTALQKEPIPQPNEAEKWGSSFDQPPGPKPAS